MINFVIRMFKRYPWFKRLNAKVTYEILAKKIPAENWQFMNYGYEPNPTDAPITFSLEGCVQRYPMQMYHYLATKADLEGKDVLEVGSGRGGGAYHVASVLKPASYVGLDIAASAVALSNRLHKLPNLKFIQGSAEKIPLADESVDVVLNVESCHAYGNVDTFLSEVKRVLRPGGYLLLVDFRSVESMNLLKSQLKAVDLEWKEDDNISQNVINAMDAEDESKRARIKELVPPKWQKLFSEFAGVVGSKLYVNLKNEERLYHRFVLRKAG